jgi:holo-[acyl-carrier protein] synthase
VKYFGLGVDIEEVERFGPLLRNTRFLKRVFTDEEISYCRQKKNKAQHLAVRFAAKEAVWKAISELLRKKKLALGHRDIGVRNDPFGKPQVILPKALARWTSKISLTLSHSRSHAVAVAVVRE